MFPRLILASSSPRRRELLDLLGLPFDAAATQVDECLQEGEGPVDMVQRLSQAKALALQSVFPESIVIAADTTVVLEGQILGKPADQAEARAMLKRLRARPHVVYSGLALSGPACFLAEVVQTTVWMRPYSDEEIALYVSSGDPLDKAGAYSIQHLAFRPVERVEGCYASVMGLPLCHLYRMLKEIGLHPPEMPPPLCEKFLRYKCPAARKILEIERR